jgi:hypothetical protein
MPILLADPRRLGPDTVPALERAAGQRSADADVLSSAGRDLAAIYLYGYATEMRIKAAYFRTLFGATGLDPRTTIDLAARGHAVNEFRTLGLAARPGPHDIPGWAQLLVAKRFGLGMRYPPNLEREVNRQAGRIGGRWSEILRYRANRPYRHEIRAVREAAGWYGFMYPYL